MREDVLRAVRVGALLAVPAGLAAMPFLLASPRLFPAVALDGSLLSAATLALARAGLRELGRAAGSAVLTVALVLFVAGGVLPRLGLYRPVTVYSNSMKPTFGAGDMIVVTRAAAKDVRVGDVITYAIPIGDRHTESHRVVEVVRRGTQPVVVTKGDANDHADPWQAKLDGSTVWRYRARLPYAGYLAIFLRLPFVQTLCLVLLPLLVAAFMLARIWGYRLVRAGAARVAAS